MSRKCIEQLNSKDILEQFDSKINNGVSEKVATLEILNEQIDNFKKEYISFVTDFKDSTSEIAKFKVIEDNINSQIQELLKPEIKIINKSEQLFLFSELSEEENNNLTEQERATIEWQKNNC